ncbi:MAG: TetR/AcrR family transcriptional regulator [Acidimicrobiales bacterium]|nr:TetR/AcrR family transcriptional regulator [Acidimicrobiales bacterium]
MPSENVDTSVEPVVESTVDVVVDDRRSRKREARRLRLLEIAAEIVEDHGVDGLTMAALGEASDYATASLYTYFSSRSALVAALQQWALEILGEVALQAVAKWDQDLAEDSQLDERVKALARLCAFSDLFLAAPVAHRREFRLQQELLITPGVQDVGDAGSVVPIAMTVLAVPQGLLAHAAQVGALNNHGGALDLAGVPLEVALGRTLAWVLALNGTLLADGLVTGLASTGAALGTQVSDAMLIGWGADPDSLAVARSLSSKWQEVAL